MPGTLKPAGAAASTWEWVQQMFQSIAKRLHALENSQTQIILDQYGNAVIIIGQLNQTVTTGASFGMAGTTAGTGLTGAGIAVNVSGTWRSLANYTYP